MFQKIKVWWALRKAKKLEDNKVLGENNIAKDERLFLEESDELKKLINKTLIMNKQEKPTENAPEKDISDKIAIKRNIKKKTKKVTKNIVKKIVKQKTNRKTTRPKVRNTKKKVKAKKVKKK